MIRDVVIVGGGPGGLQAALSLGRARKQVLLCDSGPRRNAAAVHMQNFVTRDGIPPTEVRRIAREQIARYPTVEVRDVAVASVAGERGAFRVTLRDGEATSEVTTRRILLATGMVDVPPEVEGFRALWGHSIFQCPYCHGFEIQDRRWGYWPKPSDAGHVVPFALQARGWTSDLVLFTGGAMELPADARAALDQAGIRVETAPIARLDGKDDALEAVVLADGRAVARDALFAHPPQRQVDLVRDLGVALDADGFVVVDPMRRETSIPGVFAAGDLTSRQQAAILAAAQGMQAAAVLNVDVMMERAARGAL